MNWLFRPITILRTFARYRLLELLPKQLVGTPLKLAVGLCGLGASDRKLKKTPDAVRLRLALQELGPIYVKFGQLLSTRRDMLPNDIANELSLLQDQVDAFGGERARQIVEQQLRCNIDGIFSSFDIEPLASASVAQVHTAKLKDGTDVVVKVIRPGIEKVIERDVKLLLFLASTLERHSQEARRLHLVDIVNDYEKVIFAELDLKQEAANTSQLKHNFESSDELRHLLAVPAVYWDFCTEKVLVMQRVYGVPVSHVETLKANNTDLELLAARGVEIFFTQVFEHNFFHADMHPGNVFIDTTDPFDPHYIALDCAIMGSLSELDRYYVARILLAALDRDYRLVTTLYLESGWLKPDTHPPAFESLIRSVCEPIFSKPLAELSFGTLLIYLFQAARRFGMEVQPSQVLLQKTLINIEGLGQQLYPQLDLWQTAQPFLQQWIADRYSISRLASELKQHAPSLLEILPTLPERLIANFHPVNPNGQAQEKQRQHEIKQLELNLHRQKRYNLLLAIALIIGLTTFFSQ